MRYRGKGRCEEGMQAEFRIRVEDMSKVHAFNVKNGDTVTKYKGIIHCYGTCTIEYTEGIYIIRYNS